MSLIINIGSELSVFPKRSLVEYLVDKYSPEYAYSLRKLSSTATKAIRVRRNSDNAEQDIGFNGDDIDESAITSFVGSNSGYVAKIYDQNGSGKDLSLGTSTNQGLVVSAGTLLKKNSKVRIDFGGTRQIRYTSALLNTSTNSMFNVVNGNATGENTYYFSSANNGTPGVVGFIDTNTSTPNRHIRVTNTGFASGYADLSVQRSDTDQRLLTHFLNSGNVSAFDNGATGGTGTYSGTITNDYFWLGKGSGTNAGNISWQETIIFNSVQTSIRTDIEDNINDYYSIY